MDTGCSMENMILLDVSFQTAGIAYMMGLA